MKTLFASVLLICSFAANAATLSGPAEKQPAGNAQSVTCSITDKQGNVVSRQVLEVKNETVKVEVPAMKSGLYLLKVKGSTPAQTQRVKIQLNVAAQ